MADSDGYNGWRNYETWAVALWVNNDQGSQADAEDIVKEHRPDRYEVKTALKAWIEETFLDDVAAAGLASDLLGAATDRIDWYEIADAFMADVPEDDENDEE